RGGRGEARARVSRGGGEAPRRLGWGEEGGGRGLPLRASAGRFYLHPARPPQQVELEIDQLLRAEFRHLRADAERAAAQPPLERAQVLPLQPVDRIPGRMRLRYHRARELFSPVVVVALGAGEVELALAAVVSFSPGLEESLRLRVDPGRDRQSARLARDVGFEREQLLALVREGRCLLAVRAAGVDPLLEVERLAARGIERRIARCDPFHARLCV